MERKWWKEAVGYQIYPKSFYDTTGDGIGDLRGIIEKLDYLEDLGINLIWLCPIYKSPMDDNGYDVSDYFNIAREFGTLEDFKELLVKAKEKQIKIIMDLVLNHTSDEHPWFIEARQSKDNPYRDYYIWQPGKKNALNQEIEPTNWSSFFTPSCWTKDEETNEYYMHIFSKKMPDLNWQNKKMRQELYQMISWWLDLGIDGFRVDAVAHLDRDFSFNDSIKQGSGRYREDWSKFSNLPKVHDFLKELNKETLSKYNVMTVGEVGGDATVEAALHYVETAEKELDMVFTFNHCWLNQAFNALDERWENRTDLYELKQIFKKWQKGLYSKAWHPLYWLNHDHPRVMSQYGDPVNHHQLSGKMLGTALLMMWGTPFIYNGEEIGMTNANYPAIEDYRDSSTIEKAQRLIEEGHSKSRVLKYIQVTARDNARTPMQWSADPQAGFTTGTPWIKVVDNYPMINVESQQKNSNSLLNHYKKLISLRCKSEYKNIIVYGDYTLLAESHEAVYAYIRHFEERKLLIVCNFFENETSIKLSNLKVKKILLSNYSDSSQTLEDLNLRAFEAVIYEVS